MQRVSQMRAVGVLATPFPNDSRFDTHRPPVGRARTSHDLALTFPDSVKSLGGWQLRTATLPDTPRTRPSKGSVSCGRSRIQTYIQS